MKWKLVLLACSLFITLLSCVADGKSIPSYQYQSGDSEVEFVTGATGTDGYAPGGFPSGFPRGFGGGIPGYPQGPSSIFKDWMTFIQGFFKGNWDNGGPGNFAKFLGNQISRLIEMLTRDDSGVGKK